MRITSKVNKLLEVRCAQCGSCCCDPLIELTDHDLRRLVRHTSADAASLIRLYSPDDMTSSDEHDWINLSYGKRLIGLRKKRNGECIFLSEDRQCHAYEARPMACRIFPVDVILDENDELDSLELSDVVKDGFVKCKRYYSRGNPNREFLKTAEQAGRETVSYLKKINRWNQLSEKGKKDDFLEFLGFRADNQ